MAKDKEKYNIIKTFKMFHINFRFTHTFTENNYETVNLLVYLKL